MPELGGIEVLNAVQRDKLSTKVMLLTGFEDSGPAYEAMALGAAAYISKDSEIERDLRRDQRPSRAGETVIGDRFQSGLVAEIRMRESGRPADADRARARGAEADLGRQCRSREVAAELHLSDATVKTHLHHVYEKLEVSDRAAAVARAMRWGLIE